MSQAWYYAKDDQKHGPCTSAELKALARSGALVAADLVWTEGMKDWQPASSIKGLITPMPPTPPPLKPKAPAALVTFEAVDAPIDATAGSIVRQPWYRHWAVLSVTSLFAPPVTLVLVWWKSNLSKRARWAWTGGSCLWWLILIAANQTQKPETNMEQSPPRAVSPIAGSNDLHENSSLRDRATDSISGSPANTLMGKAKINHDTYTHVLMPQLPASRIHAIRKTEEVQPGDRSTISIRNDSSYISKVSMSAVKNLVASEIGSSGVIKIWSLKNRELVTTLKSSDAGGATSTLCFSPSGSYLLTASTEYRLWNVDEGWKKSTLARQKNGCLYAAAFSPDSKVIAGVEGHYAASLADLSRTSSVSGTGVRLWNTVTGDRFFDTQDGSPSDLDLTSIGGEPRCLAISNSLLACGTTTGDVRIWNWRDKHTLATIKAHDGRVMHLAFSTSDKLLATAGIGGDIRLWNTTTGEAVREFSGHGKAVFVTFLANDDLIGTINTVNQVRENEMLHIWNASSGKKLKSRTILDAMMSGEGSAVTDGGLIAVAGSHLIQVRSLLDDSKGDDVQVESVPDLSLVDFTKGPNGEPIQMEEARPGDESGTTPQRNYFYRNSQGRKVLHGTSTTFSANGKVIYESLWINGTMKALQEWEPWRFRPIRREIYKGDTNHTREYWEYTDLGKGSTKKIERFKVRHSITPTGEKTELIPHGVSMVFFDNSLVQRVEEFSDGKLIGTQSFDPQGRLVLSQGSLRGARTPSP